MGKPFSGLNDAAETAAASTGKALASLQKDVAEMKTVLIQKVVPEVNKSLQSFQRVLSQAEGFIATADLATKALVMLIFLCAALVCQRILSTRTLAAAERIIVRFVNWMCLLMVIFLVLNLVEKTLDITWAKNGLIIAFIPSLTTLAICLQYLVQILKSILRTSILLFYCIFGLPITLFWNPVSKGYYYTRLSIVLSTFLFSTYVLLYSLVPYFALICIQEILVKYHKPLFERVLASYIIFFAATFVIYIIWQILLRLYIRPMWAFSARRNLYLQ